MRTKTINSTNFTPISRINDLSSMRLNDKTSNKSIITCRTLNSKSLKFLRKSSVKVMETSSTNTLQFVCFVKLQRHNTIQNCSIVKRNHDVPNNSLYPFAAINKTYFNTFSS